MATTIFESTMSPCPLSGQMTVPLVVPHPNSKHCGPTILGHEFVGKVVDAGTNAKEMLGVRVACGAGVSCGTCRMCKEGRTNLCNSYCTLGLSCPAGCRGNWDLHLYCSSRSRSRDHSNRHRAVTIGCRKKFGAHHTILTDPQMSPGELLAIYGAGADIVFETSGSKGAPSRALTLTRNGGMLLLLGLNKTPQDFVFSEAVLREITLETSAAHICADDIPAALEILSSGEIAPLLIERVLSLEDALEAFEAISAGTALGKLVTSPIPRNQA